MKTSLKVNTHSSKTTTTQQARSNTTRPVVKEEQPEEAFTFKATILRLDAVTLERLLQQVGE